MIKNILLISAEINTDRVVFPSGELYDHMLWKKKKALKL